MKRLTMIACAVAGLCSFQARADLEFEANTGVGFSDNITRVNDGEIDETILVFGAGVNWHEDRRRFNADVDIDLSYLHYLEDTYDGELTGTGNANLVFGIVPERFTWMFEDTYGQLQTDPFSPPTPDNRQGLNFITTGPDVIFNVGAANTLRLLARYSLTQAEQDETLDADRRSGGFAFVRRVTERTQFGLQGLVEHVEYDNVPDSEFDRTTAFLSYGLDAPRTQIDAQAGYSWLERTAGQQDEDPFLDLTVTRELSSATSIVLTAGSQSTDAGSALRDSIGDGMGSGAPEITASADPFENRHVGLDWRFQKRRTGISIGVRRNEQIYNSDTQFDLTRTTYGISYTRRLSAATDFGANLSATHEDFVGATDSIDERRGGVSLTWRIARTYGLRFTFDRVERNAAGTDGDSVEHRAFLTFNYFPRGPISRGGGGGGGGSGAQ